MTAGAAKATQARPPAAAAMPVAVDGAGHGFPGAAEALRVLLTAARNADGATRRALLEALEAAVDRPTRLYVSIMLSAPPRSARLTPGITRQLLRCWPPLLPAAVRIDCARSLYEAHVDSQQRSIYVWVRSDRTVIRGRLDPPELNWPRPLVERLPWLLDRPVEACRIHWAALERQQHALTEDAIRRYVRSVRDALRRSRDEPDPAVESGRGGLPVPQREQRTGRLDRLQLHFRQPQTDIHVFAGYHSYPPLPFIEPDD